MTSAVALLVSKLKELFRIDQPDLDFGLYRVMHAKSAEALRFLEEDLPSQLRAASPPLEAGGDGGDPSAFETRVAEHLHRFFRRYYAGGEFAPNRVDGSAAFAIPRDGEDVKLHWANRDQHYVRTSANLRDYTFRSGDARIHFRLVAAAQGEHGNVAPTKIAERVFVLAPGPGALTRDEDDVTVRFEYRPATAFDWPAEVRDAKNTPPSQRELVAIAKARIVAVGDPAFTTAPAARELETHLRRFTAKSTFDSFIHEDLGGFLRRELDFYVKSEVLELGDVAHATAESLHGALATVKAVTAIGGKLIAVLDAIERFQKKLWLKKKLVVETRYLIALGAVPESFYEAIARNDAQVAEWCRDFAAEELTSFARPLPLRFLRDHPSLMIDTRTFDAAFTARLLAAMTAERALEPDGVLVHGENFQALRLLSRALEGKVDGIYIDPPYNAKTSEIAYKNTFKHSSWLSMMHDRLGIARGLLAGDGVLVCAIDENEQERLGLLLEEVFPGRDRTCVSVVHNPRGKQGAGFSYTHEFAYFVHRAGLTLGRHRLAESKSKPLMKTGSESERATAKSCFYPIYVRDGVVTRFGDVAPEGWSPAAATITHEGGEIEVWPISSTDRRERKWRYARQSVEAIREQLEVRTGRGGEPTIYLAKFEEAYRTVWSEAEFNAAEHGTTLLDNIIPGGEFSFPKSLWTVYHALAVARVPRAGTVLDFFGGSGTTAHAVVHLNREDGGSRRFVIAEMGTYFDSVVVPRIKKIAFTPEWQDGRPKRLATHDEAARGPRVVKVLRLESYEDTLNNLELRRVRSIDSETEALLDVGRFADPRAYTLVVQRAGTGGSEVTNVDLVETFQWLLGIRASRMSAPHTFAAAFERACEPGRTLRLRGGLEPDDAGPWWLRWLIGHGPEGEVLVVWRTLTSDRERDNVVLDAWLAKEGIDERAFDAVYVNGHCNVAGARLVEEAFHDLLFDGAVMRRTAGLST